MSQSREMIVGVLAAGAVIGSAVLWPGSIRAAEERQDAPQAVGSLTEVELPQLEVRDQRILPEGTG
ncbi:MAG: hypothetical protein ABL965_08840, partial [Nitrospira sp.]